MRILVFQHLDVETPGIFAELWREAGHEVWPIELDAGERIPDLDPFDMLAVMGGPMDVWQHAQHPWLGIEKAAIRHWINVLDRPYLGICLGHQLMADALGGTVGPMTRPEVGIADIHLTEAGLQDPIFVGIDREISALHWHGAEVSKLPEDCEILAANDHCAIQAFRRGRQAYGFQFHIEITGSTVSDWNRIAEYRASLVRVLGEDGADSLQSDIAQALPNFNALARRINENFFKLF